MGRLAQTLGRSKFIMPTLATVEEEIYTHEYLWRSATALAKRFLEDASDSHHLLLPTLLTSIMAFEAFVNFAGYVVCPELWAEEKKNFRGKGISGKLGAISKQLPEFAWNPGRMPYQELARLITFRDLVAHGMVQNNQYLAERKAHGTHFTFSHEWDSYLTPTGVTSAMEKIKEYCQSLLVEIRKTSDHLHLSFNAFEGSLASASSSSRAA